MRFIQNIRGNDKEKYFLLFESYTLFLSQAVNEFGPKSFEARVNPFALYAFFSKKVNLPKHLHFAGFKLFRVQSGAQDQKWDEAYDVLHWIVVETVKFLKKKEERETSAEAFFPPDDFWRKEDLPDHTGLAKVVLTGFKSGTSSIFEGYWVDQEGEPVLIRADDMMRIENQMKAVEMMKDVYFPVTVHLFDTRIRDNILYPSAMVILPDYLMDITAISNCFSPFGEMTSIYWLDKIKPYQHSHYLLIGNCVNVLLDELIYNPSLEWDEASRMIFRINELQWTLYSDEDIRVHLETIETHFYHLKNTVQKEFLEKGIKPEDCAIEPSFYSPVFGLQGRLDLLYEAEDDTEQKIIIELKSGKTFRPNSYGLNHPHYLQTLLYDLLIRTAYPQSSPPVNYILYSSEEENNLRHAPAIIDWQYEALGVRNQILLMEWQLAQWTKNDTTLYGLLKTKNENLIGFVESDRRDFYRNYEASEPVARAYFDEYLKFLIREQMISKLGLYGADRKGQSQLWNSSWENKNQQFQLLSHLEVIDDQSFDDHPTVTFMKTDQTNPLANFRTGDVVLTYPAHRRDHPHRGQIFRCTLVENSETQVVVRLRARQYRAIFEEGSQWFLEHDHLDSSFRHMYQSIGHILRMKTSQAELFLGIQPPPQGRKNRSEIRKRQGLTKNQDDVLSSMMAMNGYYLLWGPPGTGKTSVMLKEYVREQILEDPDRKLLLLGYTNRAVDEICAAIGEIDELSEDQILRIGSRYGTDPLYRDLLWIYKTEEAVNRKEIQYLLSRCRVVCGTVASLSGQDEIFDLIDFDRIVVDEASQILEPAIISLLSRGIPYILIGDHKQLPAVVTQPLEDTRVEDPLLLEVGLEYMANSYFERLFLINKEQGWDWAFGILRHQGRMHMDLMTFPNFHFYDEILSVLPFTGERQTKKMFCDQTDDHEWAEILSSRRNVFIPTQNRHVLNHKINPEEADKIVSILRALEKIRPEVKKENIGIITPYRAQIATIRYAIHQAGLSVEGLTVDTVERYQGGAKDIIIISYCVNALSQIQLLRESMTPEGVDRKLNVALTRAREQVIFLANESLMREHPLYDALVEHFGQVDTTMKNQNT